jgi:hypothetical protein
MKELFQCTDTIARIRVSPLRSQASARRALHRNPRGKTRRALSRPTCSIPAAKRSRASERPRMEERGMTETPTPEIIVAEIDKSGRETIRVALGT